MKRFPSTIQFVLDGRITTLDFNRTGLSPTTTVLNYLRSLPGHKGVKEGCAEGDCGACTVVTATLDNRGTLQYESIDSCLVFLPMIHGKQIITVENLAQNQKLHPVQQALVDHDGSQCGYCTPGIVMSMFALYRNYNQPDRRIITDALTGNLCRCTGYRPIVDAAYEVLQNKKTDHFDEDEERITGLLNQINNKSMPLEIESGGQQYLKPFTIEQALELRKAHPDALIVGGSTDVALLQTKKRVFLEKILDLSAVDELDFIVEDHHRLAIGSGTSLEVLHQYTLERFSYLQDMLKVFGSLQIRNMATIGGNIATASPIGDLLPLLLVLNSEIRLMKKNGRRDLRLEDFITGYRQTDMEKDEIIAMITFRKPSKSEIIKSYKISKRKDLDISSASGCFRLELDNNGIVKFIKCAFGGLAAMPKRAPETEDFLVGKAWNKVNVMDAAKILAGEFRPISDARSTAEARKIMAGNLLIRFWEDSAKQFQPDNNIAHAE